MSGAERAKYLYRIARILQERARELAVLETIDNGKPIKESRDVDVPRGRPLLLLRRLGRQARALGLRLAPRSASPARSSRGTSRC
jgi:acyl-CoA reductase-like NAD-dependent aldehyde dehydrogenase